MDLSRRRAEAVMQFLIEAGVNAERLDAQGFGKTQPIVENASNRDERAQNRRVEFRLPSVEGIMQQNSAAGADTVDR
jgi:outer membrane protein OmpA-like peptidoglycan-associated protein